MFDYDVFLSFASDDEEVVRPLWQQFCLSGLKVFWSDATLKQRLGESWFDSIQSALERSRHFVLVVSPSSMTSEWVKREYKAFYNHCYQAGVRRLVPVLAGTFHVSKLPLLLKDLQVSHLNEPTSVDTLISLLGGEDFNALRNRLAELENQNHALLEQVARLRIDSAAAQAANAPLGSPAIASDISSGQSGTLTTSTANPARSGSQPEGAEFAAQSDSPKQLLQLPPSDPEIRERVERAIKEMQVQGGMGLSDNNSVAVWRTLNRELAGREIPELCHLLAKGHQWDITVKALLLLNYSAVRPGAMVWQSLILGALENHLTTAGHVQDAALRLVPKLHVERRDIWRCLFEALQIAQDSRAASSIARIICDFTPPEEREKTGAVLLDALFFFDDSNYDDTIKTAIGCLNYRAAIPTLREAFSRYASTKAHYKVMCAAGLLADWDDKGAVPYMRGYIDGTYRESGSTAYFHVMKGLYRIEGSSCATYIADRILNSSPSNQHSMTYWLWQDFKNQPEIMKAVRVLGEKSPDAELKKNIESFLTTLTR